jgi:hypothetical protein
MAGRWSIVDGEKAVRPFHFNAQTSFCRIDFRISTLPPGLFALRMQVLSYLFGLRQRGVDPTGCFPRIPDGV